MSQAADFAAAWDARILHLTTKLPRWMASAVTWIRVPSRRIVRTIAAVLFIMGGVFSILPILGLWMLPLGVGLLAEDFPGMKPRAEKTLRWLIRAWSQLTGRMRWLRGR